MIKKNGSFTYYVKDNAVILEIKRDNGLIGNSYISFNCLQLQNRRGFYKFRNSILESNEDEYATINDVYSLAIQFNVRATNGHKI